MMKKKKTRWAEELRQLLLLLAGTALMAVAVRCVFEPMEIVTGGFTGVGIVANHVLERFGIAKIPLWSVNLFGNIPLLIWAWGRNGFTLIRNTILGTVLHSVFLYQIPIMNLAEGDYLLATIAGGILMGAGIGLVFCANGSTGGTDLLSMLLAGKNNANAAPGILLVLDGAVVAASVFTLGFPIAMYSLLVVYAFTKVSDIVMEGMHFAKAVYIMSPKADEISEALLHELDRGVTQFASRGMYTKKEGATVLCVLARREVNRLLSIVHRIDTNAFVIIQDVRSVRGEGFVETATEQVSKEAK